MANKKVNDGGKGSSPRPIGIDWKRFEENWDAIFNDGSKPSDSRNSDVRGGQDEGTSAGMARSTDHEPTK